MTGIMAWAPSPTATLVGAGPRAALGVDSAPTATLSPATPHGYLAPRPDDEVYAILREG